MPIYFFAHSILKQSREYFVYLCLKYQCCMNHSPVLCFLSLFPAGNLLSSYSANYTGKFTTTIHLDQSGDRSIKPNLFQNQNNVIQTSIFFLMKRIFLFSAYHFQSWSLASFYEHRVPLLAKKRRRLEPNAIQPL